MSHDRQIRILPNFSGHKENVICFETGGTSQQTKDFSKHIYEHHGDDFDAFSPGSLRMFHERIMLGQDMPSTMVITRWQKYDQIMAVALFIYPQMTLNPKCTSLVNSIDLVDRFGRPAFGHISHQHKELIHTIKHLTDSVDPSQVSQEKIYQIVLRSANTIYEFVEEGQLPPVDVPQPEYDIQYSKGPLVIFKSEDYVWDDLYREGYLYGLSIYDEQTIFHCKSPFVDVDIEGLKTYLENKGYSTEEFNDLDLKIESIENHEDLIEDIKFYFTEANS